MLATIQVSIQDVKLVITSDLRNAALKAALGVLAAIKAIIIANKKQQEGSMFHDLEKKVKARVSTRQKKLDLISNSKKFSDLDTVAEPWLDSLSDPMMSDNILSPGRRHHLA